MADKPFPVHAQLELTEDIIKQLTEQRQAFEEQSKKSDKQFDNSNSEEYYIISTKFIKQWQAMVDEALQHSAPSDAKKYVTTPQAMNQQLIKQHLKDFNQCELRRDIQEGLDFKFYQYTVMRIFSQYQGTKIPRRAYFLGAQKKVQMHPIKFQFVFVSNNWIDLIKKSDDIEIPVLTSLAYKNQTILDLLYRLVQFSKKDDRNREIQYTNNAAAKVYFAVSFIPTQYTKKIRAQSNQKNSQNSTKTPFYSNSSNLQPPGDQINTSKVIGDLEIPSDNFMLIVELQEDKWVYKVNFSSSSDRDRCEFCRQIKKLKIECRCKDAKYCSEQCKEKDWKYHVRTCTVPFQEDNTEPQFIQKENSRRGLVGLSNLGNTCYMNAALQCMLHTKALTEYFRSKRYVDEINQTNPIGSKGGQLVKSYAKFIESAWTTQDDVVTPSRLKYSVGKVKQMFSGFQQHDSQQFLLFLLDTLHEDLNRVVNKPYTSGVQNEGRPDEVVARQSWITYLKRNQSYINDLMGGQYRSEVKCPDCHNISVTFDPFLIFAVPIPSNQAKSINLYYFMSNYNNETLKITLSSKNNLVKQLKEDAAAKSKTQASQILFVVSGFNGAVRMVNDNQTVDRLINEKQLNQNGQQKQLFAMQYQAEQLQNLDKKKFLVFKFVAKGGRTLAFKRPFPMKCQNLKGSDLYNRIVQFTLNLWTKSQRTQTKQRDAKLKVLKTKVEQQKIFTINMHYGTQTQVKNKITFENKVQILHETNVTELLQKQKYEVQFQVEYAEDPYYNFNSYKTYNADSSSTSHYDYSEGPKVGSDQSYTLQECLNQMKKSQTLVEGNQVFCSKCQDLKLAQKKMQMYKASKYLVLQLRRFKQVGYQKSKNYAEVHFPIQLDLKSHVLSPVVPECYFMQNQQSFIKPKYWTDYDKSPETRYRLYGVVNHHGGLNGGHYTSYAEHLGKWYKFDDRDVTEVDKEKVVTRDAYLLFYERL